ncbi:MAG: DUF4347 domain-containing protein [Burkholderiales bacterium]|nr:DUF4347 domain-containing protein [Burkholderiales bacterium]
MKPLHQARRLWLEELEPRFLLSADIGPFAAESAPFPETVVHQAVVDVLHQTTPAATAPVVPGRFELVFIDASVPGYAQLAADVEAQNDGWRHIDVVVLDPSRDGIAQVSETLASRVQLDAVHFITHGADGAVQLGGSRFDSDTLAANERAVANWGQALKADADLLFYGCDVAANKRGQAFLDRLSAVTRADVAASENLTGAQSLGGDWKLEFSTGVIESALAVSPREQQLWAGVLGSQTLDFDTNPTSATWTANTFGPYSFPVGTGSVGISVTGDTGVFSSPTPDVESTFNGGTGERALRLQTAGFGPGQSTTITLDFTAFGGGVSNVSFMVFDIDTSADGAGFVDSVKVTANHGAAINPTSVVLGDQTLGGPGPYTAYDVFDGVNTVTGDPAQDRNSRNSESYGNARFTFNASGISSVTIVYSNLRGLSPQGIALHDVSFDPTPTAADRTVATSEDTAYVFTTAGFGYLDPDADPMQSVRITQLPTAGTLTLAGFGTVTLGQTIAAADIAAGKLAFAAAADANGTPYGSFRFRVSDGAGFSRADYAMTVDVTAVNDASVLDASESPILATEQEDAGPPSGAVGTLVSVLVDFAVPAGQVDNVTDVDAGAQLGIAVTAADTANGSWFYSTNGGGTWVALGLVADNSARLLAADASTRIYFQPNANWNGTLASAITFRAWDQTSGANGALADTTANGGTTAFSAATDTASITVTAVNDAPTTAASGGVLSYTENDPATRIDGTLTVFDVDSADLAGATVQLAGGTYQPGEDILAFDRALLPGGVTASWNAGAGTLSFTGTAPVLQYQALLRSVSYQNTSDDPSAAPRTVSFVVDDGTAPSAPATRDIAVTPVNDAPAIVANQLTIGDGQTVVLTPANLVTIDPDNSPTDLSFTVSAVQNGRFELIGARGVPITTFTYVQLAAGQVQFVHAGGNQVPSYVVTPSDGALAGTATMAAIAFMPSLGTAGDFGTLSPQAGGGDIALAVLAPPTPSASSGTSLASPSMRDTAPIPRGLAEFEPIVLPEQPILAAPSRVAVVAGDPGIAKIDPKADYEPLRVLQMPGPHVGFDLGRLAFDDAQGRGDVEVLMGSVKMTGLVLSVGVIWWASRAAGLIASALSALPAWRNFDPIFVVGRDEDDDFKWETPQDEEAQREEEAVAEALDSVRRPDPADRSGSSKAQREGTSDQVIPAKPMIARRP